MYVPVGNKRLDLTTPKVMGVLNVTPDSFSDGGRFVDFSAATEHAHRMLEEGAAIVDVGGESTRPGARDVSINEELRRVIPIIEWAAKNLDVVVSVDTSKPEVMTQAADAGATLINDVYALRRDGALEAAAATGCAVCLMHMQGEPRTMQHEPEYRSVVRDVSDFLRRRVGDTEDAGVPAEKIIVDPGFGFGKTPEHNVKLLADLHWLQRLGRPVMVGLSRKSTLGVITGRDEDQRVSAGVAAAVLAVERGANIVRTHDVEATIDAVAVTTAIVEAANGNGDD